jgi:glycosyltransferase involved in cell wall biosynthesis
MRNQTSAARQLSTNEFAAPVPTPVSRAMELVPEPSPGPGEHAGPNAARHADPAETITDNIRWPGAAPVLSVLLPFFRNDPRALLRVLDQEKVNAEIILVDDGSADPELARAVAFTVRGMQLPARFIHLDHNEGRARGRNRLATHARASTFLFLDSDMLPDGPCFLRTYVRLISLKNPPVAFGGFSIQQVPRNPEMNLHRYMAQSSDCAPAEVRRKFPEKHVFTSNLLVRRDVFESEAFNENFRGWGWEDVEWAMRVARRYPLMHLDNPATHLGLDKPHDLAAKYEQSTENFSLMLNLHPDTVARYGSYRAARMLKRVPLRSVWSPACKAVALTELAPLPARALAMRLYRSSLYADAV